MIKYEHGMLVLSSAFTKQDQQDINNFVEDKIKAEKLAIYNELAREASGGHLTIALFKLKEIFKL